MATLINRQIKTVKSLFFMIIYNYGVSGGNLTCWCKDMNLFRKFKTFSAFLNVFKDRGTIVEDIMTERQTWGVVSFFLVNMTGTGERRQGLPSHSDHARDDEHRASQPGESIRC